MQSKLLINAHTHGAGMIGTVKVPKAKVAKKSSINLDDPDDSGSEDEDTLTLSDLKQVHPITKPPKAMEAIESGGPVGAFRIESVQNQKKL